MADHVMAFKCTPGAECGLCKVERELAEARAEVAELREDVTRITTLREITGERNASLLRELEKARALLAQCLTDGTTHDVEVRAFLRRDESRRCTCTLDNGTDWVGHDGTFHHPGCPVLGRDVARRCTCRFNGSQTAAHEYDCPARDEARRSSDKPSDGR